MTFNSIKTTKHLPRWAFILRLSGILILCFLILHFLFPLKNQFDYSRVVLSAEGEVMKAYLSSDDKWRLQIHEEEISEELEKAFLKKEDQYFYYHPGVNPFALLRAFVNNVRYRKRLSGASTITMQVARMLEPKKRTYFNKLIEIFRALQLELKFSKDEIFTLYLNLVPYGGNIEGVKSASLLFFGKMPNHLSLSEIVTLIVIPNRPQTLKANEKNALIKRARDKWIQKFKKWQTFPEQMLRDAIEEPLQLRRRNLPDVAPHLCRRLISNHKNLSEIKTTIAAPAQQKIQALTKSFIDRLKHQKITNAAVLVLDNKSGNVLAYVGSADFLDAENAGQVDGVMALRSPGSTLKPFLYALAMDAGLVTPKFMITDVPVNYAGYSPENYDQRFNGKVTIDYALTHSLNIPAVKILDQYGVQKFTDKLIKGGFKSIQKKKKQLGLSMILGGCGTNLFELTRLYSAFANLGALKRAKFLSGDTSKSQVNLLSKESAWLINDNLSKLTRPDLPKNWQYTIRSQKMAWKTGTSYGRRDAWSIGYNSRFTIGVWVGNFSGEGNPALSGSDIATPLLFQIMGAIDYGGSNNWFAIPEKLELREVCNQSGLLASNSCENIIMDYAIAQNSPMDVCNCKISIKTNLLKTMSYCVSCEPNNGSSINYYENLAPELAAWYESEHIRYQKIPEHNPNCTRVFEENPPRIVSPTDNAEYLVEKYAGEQITLQCQAYIDVKSVFWYVNGKFITQANTQSLVTFSPKEGDNTISCTDDKGRTKTIKIRVKYY